VAAAGSEASLEIGNTSAAGLTDVRIIDASTFDNGATLSADVTDASVAKYMDRTDTAGDASADNADFAYTTGAGADTLDINISEANLAASGTANREDFSMAVSTGAGNDSITMQIGDGDMGAAAWANHQLMDANADSRIGVDAGAGDDMVHTNGETIFRIDLGAGNDAGYTDNSGAQANVAFNDGRATWVFNNAVTNDVVDLRSDHNDDYALYQQTVNVNYKGYTVSQIVTDFNTTDLEMNNMIKDLIQSDEHLSDLIVAEDGPGNTLVVRSLIDGVDVAGDLAVSLTANTAISAMSEATINLFNAANGITDATPTTAEVQTAVNAGLAGWNFAADYASELGDEDNAHTTSEVQEVLIATNATGAGTVTLNIGGVNVSFDVAVGDTPTAQGDALVAAVGAEELLNGVVTVANTAGDVKVTFVGTAKGQDVAEITVSESAATGSTYTVTDNDTASAGGADIVGADSTADNDNTITDGTGEDTIVLSTDADSSETVVLVADGETDVIVNYAFGGTDVVNLGTQVLDALESLDTGNNGSITAANDDSTVTDANGDVAVVGASDANDTAAEILALYTTDSEVANTDDTMVYAREEADGGLSLFVITDGAAAGDQTITEYGTVYLM
ncbi:hypothetical protein N9O01_03215, partial [Planktomarina temperata]|nr:hypothetical protein [Planktomarina temperata]